MTVRPHPKEGSEHGEKGIRAGRLGGIDIHIGNPRWRRHIVQVTVTDRSVLLDVNRADRFVKDVEGDIEDNDTNPKHTSLYLEMSLDQAKELAVALLGVHSAQAKRRR